MIDLMKEAFKKGNSFRFKAKGFSMSPFIKGGDVITIKPLKEVSLIIGDIVSFISPKTNSLAVHRIVSIKKNGCVFKGDNSFNSDGLVLNKDILGVINKIERNNKDITFGLGKEKGIIVFLSRTRILFLFLKVFRGVRRYTRRFFNGR
ncbi:MAG: S26 family signal peptidase [Candidatus Omnitrophota bacterium]